jgi:hypothetical protein
MGDNRIGTIETKARSISIMVLYAIALHLSWAVILLFDHQAINATALNALARYIYPPELLVWVIASAAIAALIALSTRRPWIVLLLLPQQVLLMMSASGAAEAIWLSQFADGVIRSRSFIAADQLYSILAAIGHTAAITIHAIRVNR